ncbi:MAG: Mth938-like domain-containing protein [Betaproteobacteria bacterium]|nr:Mth938-like domain-containing protein [Betaproteobacteria bacterium]
MKLHRDQPDLAYTITGHGPGYIQVNATRHATGLVVLPDEVVTDWAASLAELVPAHFDVLLIRAPEIVLLGTGARHTFPSPALYAVLLKAGIGVEVMDTPAACRTYNVLAGEGRRVAAGLIPIG